MIPDSSPTLGGKAQTPSLQSPILSKTDQSLELKTLVDKAFLNTLKQAQNKYRGFINGFYDDELWWVLAWVQVYDVTKDDKYLQMAADIFEDDKKAYGTSNCGALWWNKAHTGTNSVENELYLTAAAKLATRRSNTPSVGYYLNEATKTYQWFIKSGFINCDNLVNDHLNKDCENDGTAPVFTYNQANKLAQAGTKYFADDKGILHEKACEPNCSSDLQQFKGVFARGIQFMVNRANPLPEDAKAMYVKFLKDNADSIWKSDQKDGELGLVWNTLGGGAPTLQTDSSALDVLVGAAAVV